MLDDPVAGGAAPLLRHLLENKDRAFWPALRDATARARFFEEMFGLHRLALKARRHGVAGAPAAVATVRLAVLGAVTTSPLVEFACHLLEVSGVGCQLFVGEYDNYVSELVDPTSPLYAFEPDTIVLFPSSRHVQCPQNLTDSPTNHRADAARAVNELLALSAPWRTNNRAPRSCWRIFYRPRITNLALSALVPSPPPGIFDAW